MSVRIDLDRKIGRSSSESDENDALRGLSGVKDEMEGIGGRMGADWEVDLARGGTGGTWFRWALVTGKKADFVERRERIDLERLMLGER